MQILYFYLSSLKNLANIHIPTYGLTVVVDGGLGSASGGITIHSSSDTTLNMKSSNAIQRSIFSPMSASIVNYDKVVLDISLLEQKYPECFITLNDDKDITRETYIIFIKF